MMTFISAARAVELVESGAFYSVEPRLGSDAGEELTLVALNLTISETGEDFVTVHAIVVTETAPDALSQPFYTLTVDLVFPDLAERTRDAFQWRLVLRAAETVNNQWNLTLQSHESLVRDHALDIERQFTEETTLATALSTLLRTAIPDVTLQLQVPNNTFLEAGETLDWANFSNAWAGIQEICDLVGATCYFDKDRFVVAPIDATPGAPVYSDNGLNIVGSPKHSYSRDDFANAVRVTYENGVSVLVQQTTGAYSINTIPRKLFKEHVPRGGNHRQATARAQAVLARKLIQGERLDITLARVLLHLRPRDTIEIALASGVIRGLIETLAVDLLAGETSLTLRSITKES